MQKSVMGGWGRVLSGEEMSLYSLFDLALVVVGIGIVVQAVRNGSGWSEVARTHCSMRLSEALSKRGAD